jgi:ribosomal-protein-alanine N-acetyltransferase
MIWPLRRGEPGLRPLLVADAEACAGLHKTGFAHPWSADEFEALLSSASVSGSLAALRDDLALGFVLSRRAATEAEILTLVVRPDHRRRGLGLALMADQLSRLAALGVESVVLEADEANAAALALYGGLGFARVGARPSYYRRADGSASHALILRCTL